MVSCAEMESKHDEYVARQTWRQKHTYIQGTRDKIQSAEYVGYETRGGSVFGTQAPYHSRPSRSRTVLNDSRVMEKEWTV